MKRIAKNKINSDDLIPTEKAKELAKKIPEDRNNPHYKNFDFDSFMDSSSFH